IAIQILPYSYVVRLTRLHRDKWAQPQVPGEGHGAADIHSITNIIGCAPCIISQIVWIRGKWSSSSTTAKSTAKSSCLRNRILVRKPHRVIPKKRKLRSSADVDAVDQLILLEAPGCLELIDIGRIAQRTDAVGICRRNCSRQRRIDVVQQHLVY